MNVLRSSLPLVALLTFAVASPGCLKRAAPAPKLEPFSVQLLSSTPQRETHEFDGVREDVQIDTRTGDRTPRVVASAETDPIRLQGGRAELFGDTEATRGWSVDNVLLLEFVDARDAVFGRVAIGFSDPVLIDGEHVDNMGARKFSFEPGEIDLTSRLPENEPFRIRATALDYSGAGRVSDLFLRVEPRDAGSAGEDDLRGM